jgi:hypothetical protein
MVGSVCLSTKFTPSEITIKIIDKFLFIEAVKTHGVKGKNFVKHSFKTCIELPPNSNVKDLRAFYNQPYIRVGIGELIDGEVILPIDKLLSTNSSIKPQTYLKYRRNTPEEFEGALRLAGMID